MRRTICAAAVIAATLATLAGVSARRAAFTDAAKGDFDAALRLAEKRLDDDSAAVDHAFLLVLAGRPGEAMETLDGRLDDEAALRIYGYAALRARRFGEAMTAARRLLAGRPEDVTGRAVVAEAMWRLGAVAGAREILQTLPAEVRDVVLLRCALEDDRTEEATAALARLKEVAPGADWRALDAHLRGRTDLFDDALREEPALGALYRMR